MRILRRVLLIIAIVIVVLVVAGYLTLDAIARGVIDSQGSSVLGVRTSVDSVRLAVFSQNTSLSGLSIANPEGFNRPNFLTLDHAEIEASVGTLMSSDIEIPSVHIKGLTVDLEQINEHLNAAEIVKNVEKNTGTAEDAKADDGDAVDFNIKTLVVDDIHLVASGSIVNIAGGHLDTKIPHLELHNLGTKTNGDQISHQLISMMLGVLMKHIASHPIEGLSGAAVGSVATALENIPIFSHTGAGQKLGNVLKDANQSLNKGAKKIGEGIKGIGSGLGNLLGGDSEKGDDEKTPESKPEGGEE